MKRREFIILSSVGATGATVLSSCGNPDHKLIPALIPDEEYVPGIDYWKATSCSMCEAGCGIVVRTREHKASKIEGNPLHPVNRGALCARGQAGLQVLYNPDRLRGPMRRTGERGSSTFEEISWEEAIKQLAAKLREIKAEGRAEGVVFVSGDPKGVTGLAAELFMSACGASKLFDTGMLNDLWARAAYEGSYHQSGVPVFDIANARYLLSFGARFLEAWHSPVKYSLAYGEFRRAPGRPRGKFVQVEPRMSLTAANADEWLPAAVGTEALVALAIAQVIIREGLLKNTPSPADVPDLGAEGLFAGSLETTSQSASTAERLQAYAPEKTESITGIPSDKVIRIAREFATSQASLAIGCGSELIEQVAKGQASLKKIEAIHFLNKLVSNENKPGGVLLATGGDFDPLARWRNRERKGWLPLTNRRLRGQDMSAMLIHQANPVYTSSRLADLMSAVPFIVTFSSFMDETAQLADLILPDHSYLESWDIHARTGPVVNLTQPVVHPEFNTRQTADLLIALIRELGGEPPFETAEEFVKQAASDLTKARGSISADNADDFWKGFVERGVWVGEPQAGKEINKESRGRPALTAEVLNELGDLVPQHNGGEGHNLMLLTYDHAALGPGAEANLPWLQEMPDPMTSVMWGSWVEINPQTAVSLGIADGDLVEVETAGGSLRVPALIYPAIRPDVIAIPLGQGHTALGRYSNGRGVNAAALNPAAGLETSVAVRAKVTRLGSQAQLIRFGTMLPERPHTKR